MKQVKPTVGMVVWFNSPHPGAGTVEATIIRVGRDDHGVEVVDLRDEQGVEWVVHDQAEDDRPGPGRWWAQQDCPCCEGATNFGPYEPPQGDR